VPYKAHSSGADATVWLEAELQFLMQLEARVVKGGTALKAGAGATGTFTVNYAADAFGIKLPDNISAGDYSSQLSWNLKAEPES